MIGKLVFWGVVVPCRVGGGLLVLYVGCEVVGIYSIDSCKRHHIMSCGVGLVEFCEVVVDVVECCCECDLSCCV